MFEYFDSHSHLNLSPLLEKSGEIIGVLEKENIGTITVGVDLATSREAIKLAEKSKNLFAAVGLHPTEKEDFEEKIYEELVKNPKVVAVGECGLDYFHQGDKEKQRKNFEKQINFAARFNKPLMIHCRPSRNSMDAYLDVIIILKNHQAIKGNIHFFSGNIEVAKEFLNLGFTLSFAGPITFTTQYDEVIKYAPLDMILSETDAPFAAPIPYRGKTCYPYYVKEIVKKIAEIKNLDLEEANRMVVENAARLFDI